MAELHDLTALELGETIRSGEVTATEVVEHYLARIDAHGEALGAFVTVTADDARAAASEAKAAVRNAGPLAGVPTAVKDLTLTAGVRTTFGSAAFADFVPSVDSDVVIFMREAGLISLGKTTTSEFGLSLYTETAVASAARNPWAPGYTAGGSSGGAAAAVAAGLLPLAQGNDGGGSLRIPASICGVVGLKPSRGLVSNGPLGFGGFGLPTNGPIARTVADAAALLDALAVPVPGEPFQPPARPRAAFAGGDQRGIRAGGDQGGTFLDAALRPDAYLPTGRPLRVGVFRAPMLADVEPATDVVEALQSAVAVMSVLGWEVVDSEPPFAPDMVQHFETVWRVLSLSPVPPEREELLLPLTRWIRERGREIGAEQLLLAMAELQVQVRRHARSAAAYDLLLSPVLARAQAPVGWFTSAGDPAEDFARQERFSPYCAAYNITGAPALSLPLGQTADGVPIGIMLAAAVGADALLIAASAVIEAAVPWAHLHPPIWSGRAHRIA